MENLKQNLGIINSFELIRKLEKNGNKGIYYLVKCLKCGNTKKMRNDGIKNNKSCGCIKSNFKHGLGLKSKIYFMWHDMKTRCYNKKSDRYNAYGKRGITVCDEWRKDYIIFYNWALKNGWKEGLQIDRIDNDGNYCPDNCRFVTNIVNSRKRQNTIWVFINGVKVCLKEVCTDFGLTENQYKSVHHQIRKRNKSLNEAIKYALRKELKNGGNVSH